MMVKSINSFIAKSALAALLYSTITTLQPQIALIPVSADNFQSGLVNFDFDENNVFSPEERIREDEIIDNINSLEDRLSEDDAYINTAEIIAERGTNAQPRRIRFGIPRFFRRKKKDTVIEPISSGTIDRAHREPSITYKNGEDSFLESPRHSSVSSESHHDDAIGMETASDSKNDGQISSPRRYTGSGSYGSIHMVQSGDESDVEENKIPLIRRRRQGSNSNESPKSRRQSNSIGSSSHSHQSDIIDHEVNQSSNHQGSGGSNLQRSQSNPSGRLVEQQATELTETERRNAVIRATEEKRDTEKAKVQKDKEFKKNLRSLKSHQQGSLLFHTKKGFKNIFNRNNRTAKNKNQIKKLRQLNDEFELLSRFIYVLHKDSHKDELDIDTRDLLKINISDEIIKNFNYLNENANSVLSDTKLNEIQKELNSLTADVSVQMLIKKQLRVEKEILDKYDTKINGYQPHSKNKNLNPAYTNLKKELKKLRQYFDKLLKRKAITLVELSTLIESMRAFDIDMIHFEIEIDFNRIY